MPSTDNHGSSPPFYPFDCSIWSTKHEQVHSIEVNHESRAEELELESFHRQIADRFHDLSAVGDDALLPIAWTHKLLEAFVYFQEEFGAILLKNKALVSKPPLDRFVAAFFERSLKALDLFNATRDGIEKIHLWQKHLEIVKCALDFQHRTIGEGQFR